MMYSLLLNLSPRFFVGLFLLGFWLIPESATLQERIPGEFIVQVKSDEAVTAFASKFAALKSQTRTAISYRQIMSKPFNLWLLSADTFMISDAAFYKALKRESDFNYVGYNRMIQARTTPNDPDFSRQWQYVNPGGNGGVENADLDMDLAWEVTTGGLTPSGDTIVIAIIDDGINGVHEDMRENLWINYNEVPGNNIDDDGNGYVDDHRGWNVKTSNDDVYSGGGHGTPVAGIVGARGNNGKGVSGVNWNVRLMIVNYGSSTEANALAAYGYVYAMRKMYHESNGQKGAFVVATNASWGIDKTMADEAPLWCALYDSLGYAGILNCGATTNSNTDVDAEGDLPTSCTSEFLIAVTNIGKADTKVINAGYGRKSIDLAAYGQQVYTVTRTSYGLFNGTSGATPHVTGVIGLLYAAPCRILDSLAKNNPAVATRIARDMILHGTLPLPDLTNVTTTGGKLNALRALQNIMSLCSTCAPPAGITILPLEKGLVIRWASDTRPNSVSMRYRKADDLSWIEINDIASGFLLSDLDYCTTYEIQLGSDCGWLPGTYSYSSFITTAGCCPQPVFTSIVSGDSYITLERLDNNVSDILLQYNDGTSGWQDTLIDNLTFTLDSLPECKGYAFRAKSNCYPYDNESAFTETQFVSTACGTCTELSFCAFGVKDNSQEWISSIDISGQVFETGLEEKGYSNFAGSGDFTLQAGKKFPFAIEAGYKGTFFPEFFKIYIDLNQDGIFTLNEELYKSNTPIASRVSDTLTIPSDVKIGYARMRAIMSYDDFPGACDNEVFEYGEVEDYCISITENECAQDAQLKTVRVDSSSVEFSIARRESQPDTVLLYYRAVGSSEWLSKKGSDTLIVGGLESCTFYEYYAQRICGGLLSIPSQTDTVKTACISNNDHVASGSFTLSPNPTSGMMVLKSDDFLTNIASFKVTDIHGITIPLRQIIRESEIQFDVSFLVPGMYMLTCEKDGLPVGLAKFIRL